MPPGLAEALRAVRERWWMLALAAVLAAAAAYLYTGMPWVEPRYRSSIFIQATGRLEYGNTLALEKQLRPLAEQVRQRTTMRQVEDTLNTDIPVDLMIEHTKAEPVQDSSQIRVDVEDSDPRRAEQLALAITDVYVQQHNAAEQAHVREERVILFPLDRSNAAILTYPRKSVIVPAAGLLGLVAAAAVIVTSSLIDDTLKDPVEAEDALGLPVLAAIPRAGRRSPRLAGRGSARVEYPAIPAVGASVGQTGVAVDERREPAGTSGRTGT